MHFNDNIIQQSVIGGGPRGWIEIIGNILEVCEKGSLKTHIMYRCNLNSKQIEQYMQLLQKYDMIERVEKLSYSKHYIFKTTEIGRKYVKAYKQLESAFYEQN